MMQYITKSTQTDSRAKPPAELSSDQNLTHVVFEIKFISWTSNTFSTPKLILYKLVIISYLSDL